MDQFVAWNTIGDSFDATRPEPWPVVTDWLPKIGPCHLLDVMSGNGRHAAAAIAAGHQATALDWSKPLVESAASNVPAVFGDATHLPFADDSFDGAMYIAGLHGLLTAQQRRQSLAELHRVVRPGGPLLITVWSRWAKRFEDVPHDGPVDVTVPWKRDGHNVDRHYHLYTPESLRAELEATGWRVNVCEDGSVTGRSPENVVAEASA